MASDPLLSLIVPARNDAYMGDFKWRFSTCLNYLAKNLAALGRLGDVEVVVCDWNSDVPLHQELVLSPEAAKLVRFVVVPPGLARPAQRDSPFPIPIAQNVVIRRSRGAYIAQTDSDILYTPATLLALFALLDGKVPGVPVREAYLAAPRRQVPYRQVMRQPSVQELHEYLIRSGSQLREDEPGAGYAAPTAMVLLHRDLWHACRGYDERFIYWGWMDIDLALRITQRYPLLYLSNFGVNLIHLEHYVVRNYQDRTQQTRRSNIANDEPLFEANDERWGLADAQLESCCVERVASMVEPEYAPPGTVVAWPLTVPQFQAQLHAPGVLDVVQKLMQACHVGLADLNSLTALAWYATQRNPRAYVEVGLRAAYAAALVALACPGVEVSALVAWQREVLDESSLAYGAHYMLSGVGRHQASTRFIGGDPATAVKRLTRPVAGRFVVDLALVRLGPATPHAPVQAEELAAHLAPGGMIVLLAEDSGGLQAASSRLMHRYPRFTYLPFNDGTTGLVLAATLAPN